LSPFENIAYHNKRDGVALKSNHHFGEGDNISKQQFSSYFKEGIDKTKTSRQQLDSYLLIDTDTGRDHQYISAVQGKKRVKLTDTLGDCEYFQVEKMEGMKKYRMKPELFIEADKGLRAMNKTICLAVKEAKQNKEEAKRQLKEAARNLSRVVVAAKETAKQEIVERAQATVKAMDDAIDTAVDEAEEASDKAMKVLFGLADSVVDVMDDIEDVVTEVASTSVNVSLSVNWWAGNIVEDEVKWCRARNTMGVEDTMIWIEKGEGGHRMTSANIQGCRRQSSAQGRNCPTILHFFHIFRALDFKSETWQI